MEGSLLNAPTSSFRRIFLASLALHAGLVVALSEAERSGETRKLGTPRGEAVNPAVVHVVTWPAQTLRLAPSRITQAARAPTPPPSPPAALGTPDGVALPSPLTSYLYGLRSLIESRKVYPSLSKRLGESGTVLVRISVGRDGQIRNVRVQGPSNYSRLDQAALETVSGVRSYQPLPAEVSGSQLDVDVPIEFSI